MNGKKCELCEDKLGDRWVTVVKPTGKEFKLFVCNDDALWLATPAGIDVVGPR